MRIISGIYKGKRLQAGNSLKIRPTTDRVKEFIFNVLQDLPQNKNIVDIFSGSGNLAIEALSRGAKHITLVEKYASSIEIIKKNIYDFKISPEKYSVLHSSAEDYIKKDHSDREIYFLDPPFNILNLQHIIDDLTSSKYFLTGNLIVLEHEINNPIGTKNQRYSILKQKKIGRSIISFIEKG